MREVFNVNVSERTIRRERNEDGLRTYVPTKAPKFILQQELLMSQLRRCEKIEEPNTKIARISILCAGSVMGIFLTVERYINDFLEPLPHS